MNMNGEIDPTPSIHGEDENRLAELGYKQELTRNWSLLHNFGVSFSIIVRYIQAIFFNYSFLPYISSISSSYYSYLLIT